MTSAVKGERSFDWRSWRCSLGPLTTIHELMMWLSYGARLGGVGKTPTETRL